MKDRIKRCEDRIKIVNEKIIMKNEKGKEIMSWGKIGILVKKIIRRILDRKRRGNRKKEDFINIMDKGLEEDDGENEDNVRRN